MLWSSNLSSDRRIQGAIVTAGDSRCSALATAARVQVLRPETMNRTFAPEKTDLEIFDKLYRKDTPEIERLCRCSGRRRIGSHKASPRSRIRAMKTPPTRIALIALALGTAALFSGCGAATPEGVDLDINKGSIAISGTDGEIKVDYGDASIPSDFPSSVPLPDLKPTLTGTATIDGQQTWNLTYQEGTPEDYDAYVATLKATSGAESVFSMDQAGLRGETISLGEYEVSTSYAEGLGVTVLVSSRS